MNSNTIPKDPYCQSCGMPLEGPEMLGTDAADAPVRDYCIYCFRHGTFTEPRISLDEMIERSADHLMKVEHVPHLQARDLAETVIPNLKRWDRSGINQKNRELVRSTRPFAGEAESGRSTSGHDRASNSETTWHFETRDDGKVVG